MNSKPRIICISLWRGSLSPPLLGSLSSVGDKASRLNSMLAETALRSPLLPLPKDKVTDGSFGSVHVKTPAL